MKHPDQPDYVVGVAGCGAMGQGIAQVSAQGGMRVLLFDAREGAAAEAKDRVAGHIRRLAEKGRLSEADADAAIGRLEPVAAIAGLAPADCVVEAVFENADVKQALFKEIEAVVAPDCLIASNTSSIPIASLARACARRGRVAGMHFFNPVPLMKLVEVIRAAETSDETVANLMALGRRMTRVPVEVKDSPGFLVNMGGRAYTTEALRIAHEGVATPAQVDAIMRDCWGFRMGPFELMDLTGIDVNYPVSQIVYNGYNQDPRLRTSANHMAMFDAGLYGRKTGQGWFAYENGQPLERPSADFETDAEPARKVALAGDVAQVRDLVSQFADEPALQRLQTTRDALCGTAGLRDFCASMGLEIGDDDGACPILASPIGVDATTIAWSGAGHERLVCLDLLGDTTKRVVLMTAPGAGPKARAAIAATLIAAGRKVSAVKDSPGFVGQRMVAMVANLGCYMAEIGLATPEDIDTAMQLGLNYPRGSIALGESLGASTCNEILSEIETATGDDRYRPTLWLRRRAMLGLSLYTPS